MRLRSILPCVSNVFCPFIVAIALSASSRCFAAAQSPDVPAWLGVHVGEGEGQIAQVVLQRARALYFRKVREGVVRNHCYFAMDATRPNGLADGKLGRRFYVICERTGRFVRFWPVRVAI